MVEKEKVEDEDEEEEEESKVLRRTSFSAPKSPLKSQLRLSFENSQSIPMFFLEKICFLVTLNGTELFPFVLPFVFVFENVIENPSKSVILICHPNSNCS